LLLNGFPVQSPHLEGPADIGNQKYVIDLRQDGRPHLPNFDLNHVVPKDVRFMLPRTSSPGDLGIEDVITEHNNISGLHDPSTAERTLDTATEQHPASQGVAELNKNAMAEIVSDHSAQFWVKQNTESSSHTAIGTHLQDSLSPSESMVETAIRNVAHAGYLSLTHAAADQTLSQQGVNATTKTNSKSKKRTQKEMEQEGNGKQMKKRAKIAVPAREQSLRYDAIIVL